MVRWFILLGFIVLLVLALTRTLPHSMRILSIILAVILLVLGFRWQPKTNVH